MYRTFPEPHKSYQLLHSSALNKSFTVHQVTTYALVSVVDTISKVLVCGGVVMFCITPSQNTDLKHVQYKNQPESHYSVFFFFFLVTLYIFMKLLLQLDVSKVSAQGNAANTET